MSNVSSELKKQITPGRPLILAVRPAGLLAGTRNQVSDELPTPRRCDPLRETLPWPMPSLEEVCTEKFSIRDTEPWPS